MLSDPPMELTTKEANEVVKVAFLQPLQEMVRKAVQAPPESGAALYEQAGEAWALTRMMLEELPAEQRHVAEVESTLVEDMRRLLCWIIDGVWRDAKPKLECGRALANRPKSIMEHASRTSSRLRSRSRRRTPRPRWRCRLSPCARRATPAGARAT